jgi:hypothetical protein
MNIISVCFQNTYLEVCDSAAAKGVTARKQQLTPHSAIVENICTFEKCFSYGKRLGQL